MKFIAETGKSFEQACIDLEAAIVNHGFGVLHKHDLGVSLRNKGVDFAGQCAVFEVCNPVQAGRVLSADISLNMALPCRISVYTEAGLTKIGMFRPTALLAALSTDASLMQVAREVEDKTVKMIEDAC
ncbi:DUF302 domain-containing protein [Myxococcota bacterium]|nr:DUF302 domain-containing protein [Myxococcota bacterium]